MCGIFSSYGLKIIIKVNKKVVNFFDVIFNLFDGKYMVYIKFGNNLFYVNRKLNYLFRIIENNLKFINK